MNRNHSVLFETAPKNCISDSFVDYESYSISSKGFLPTVVHVIVIWVKSTSSSPFSSLIPKMLMFTLAISCLTTSNLHWFMDLTSQVPMQYCSLQNLTFLPSPVTSIVWCCFHFASISSFFLELFLHSSPVAYWAPTDWGSSSFTVISFCLFYCPWCFQSKDTEVVCHSLLWWTTNSPPRPIHLRWLYTAWLIVLLS